MGRKGTGREEMEQDGTERDMTRLGDTEQNGPGRNEPEENGTR